jgi:S-DNA-T family DNA segregation ATPase FtsK/SpoIIIE
VKWLPHARAAGAVRVFVTRHEIDVFLATVAAGRAPGHRTIAVVDEPGWWRERDAPLRPMLSCDPPFASMRLIVLAERSDELPSACTATMSEQPDDGARVEWFGDGATVDVRPFLLGRDHAIGAARAMAALDDPERAVPATTVLPVSVPLLDTLGTATRAAATIATRWRAAGGTGAFRVPLGVTTEGPVELDLDRDGPHVIVGGEAASGKSEVLTCIVAALTALRPPDAVHIAVLDGTGRATLERCTALPHVVMHHDVSDLHLAWRARRILGAALHERAAVAAGDEAVARFVVVVDEPPLAHPEMLRELLALAGAGFGSGEPAGIHLVVATTQPAELLDTTGDWAFGTKLALHLPGERDSVALLGTRDAIGVPRLAAGRGWVRFGDAEPREMQAPRVTAAGEQRLELRPFVIGRELSALESRVARGVPPTGAASGDDLARLVTEVTAAARTLGGAMPPPAGPAPLPSRVRRAGVADQQADQGVPFALADAPDARRQYVRYWRPDGNLLVYGADGAGTSSLLATLALGLAARSAADDLHLYVRDDRTGALAPLRGLPHCGGAVRHDDLDRFARMARVVCAELEHRRAAGTRSTEARIVVLIDDVGALRHQLDDRPDRDDVWDDVVRIVRDGPAFGICTVVTAKRELLMPLAFTSHAASQLVMRLGDPAGYASFGIRPEHVPRFVPGRAIDPADHAELQIVEPASPLGAAVDALAAPSPTWRPPVPVEGGRPA